MSSAELEFTCIVTSCQGGYIDAPGVSLGNDTRARQRSTIPLESLFLRVKGRLPDEPEAIGDAVLTKDLFGDRHARLVVEDAAMPRVAQTREKGFHHEAVARGAIDVLPAPFGRRDDAVKGATGTVAAR